jgi:hypothetical protein
MPIWTSNRISASVASTLASAGGRIGSMPSSELQPLSSAISAVRPTGRS